MGSQPSPDAAAAPVRLGVLMADTPLPQTASRYRDYGGVFTDLFARAVAPAPLESQLAISLHDIVNDTSAYPPLDEVDAVLITGSRHNAFDNDEWIRALVEYTQKALATTAPDAEGRRQGHGVRVIGVCFGHQIVGRALGVPVDRSAGGWEISVTEVELSPEGKKFFGLDKMRIHQMHRDAVYSYPAQTVALAETKTCPVQAMLLPGRVVTVQGHPEFTEGIVREILEARHEAGILTDDVYRSAVDRVANEHDGVAIARAFLRFLRE